MTKKKNILGIDVGGTTIKYGLVKPHGKLIKLEQSLTPKTKAGIVSQLIKIIKSKEKEISKVGIGMPGPLDIKTGTILKTPNLPLAHTPLLWLLKKKIKLPIKIDNDANCFVLAEAIIGAGKKYQNVIGLTLGTGIGGGIVINKKIYHGKSNAGEFGHQFIDFPRKKDLESFIGARALRLNPQDYRQLEQAALKNNRRVLNFWKRLGTIIGFACLNLTNILDPDIIILGGKQARAFKLFSPQLYKIINQYCLTKPPKIVKSQLIDRAGIIGAALLFGIRK